MNLESITIVGALFIMFFVLGIFVGRLIGVWEYQEILNIYKKTCAGWEKLVKDMREQK